MGQAKCHTHRGSWIEKPPIKAVGPFQLRIDLGMFLLFGLGSLLPPG